MNPVLTLIHSRKSIREYLTQDVAEEEKEVILRAALRAPTAGNLMLYSIIEVQDQAAKETLVRTCDNQPFIATAPLVLLFLADYQRWYDSFLALGVEQFCENKGHRMRRPEEGDLFLACCDALIAAQTAVLAAESLGIGSCYIGDILENYEVHKELFDLPKYALPICLVCFGYPTQQQKDREYTTRFEKDFIVFKDQYKGFEKEDFEEMYRERQEQIFRGKEMISDTGNIGQYMYMRKFGSDFAREMNRSVRIMLNEWME
jgi:FMN reductase (NADPH)/FMN reductase [NAD(P)H]